MPHSIPDVIRMAFTIPISTNFLFTTTQVFLKKTEAFSTTLFSVLTQVACKVCWWQHKAFSSTNLQILPASARYPVPKLLLHF